MSADESGVRGVPKRKTHTKSRKGCFQCKQRHIKCNEARPRCAGCVRLDIECAWPINPHGYPSQKHNGCSTLEPTEHRPLPSITPDISTPTEINLNIDELRLLHHWTAKTSLTLHPLQRHFQNEYTEIGLEHPFLLYGFLGLAAIHKIVSDATVNREMLLDQAHSHVSRALDTYRRLLVHPTAETAVPMFLLSTVLAMYSLASGQLENPEDPLKSVHHCFSLLQGIKVVIRPHWKEVKDSPVFQAMSEPVMDFQIDSNSENDQATIIVRLKELVEYQAETTKGSFLKAIEELGKVTLKMRFLRAWSIEQGENKVLFSWPATLTDQFLHLLAARNPFAAVIVSYFAALVHQAPPAWWTKSWPERIVGAAWEIVQGTELSEWLGWPLQVVNGSK